MGVETQYFASPVCKSTSFNGTIQRRNTCVSRMKIKAHHSSGKVQRRKYCVTINYLRTAMKL
jgi:hypothetical protein